MSNHYKTVPNGRGTTLTMDKQDSYVSIGKDGKDVTIRANGMIVGYDSIEQLVAALNLETAAYVENTNMSSALTGRQREVLVRLNFFFDTDDPDEMDVFTLIVPADVSNDDINIAIDEAHSTLMVESCSDCYEKTEDMYGSAGMTPAVLIEYLCSQKGWKYKDVSYGIDRNITC